MSEHLDNDLLISLVETKPVLWDKTLDCFKDRTMTKDAWCEICEAIYHDFDQLDRRGKNAFEMEVKKRWGNLRDAYSRWRRKVKDCEAFGVPVHIKRYIYAKEMQFLNKLSDTREESESLEDEDMAPLTNDTLPLKDNPQPRQISEAPSFSDDFETKPLIAESMNRRTDDADAQAHAIILGLDLPRKDNPNQRERKRSRQPDDVVLKLIKALEEPTPNPNISYLQSIVPHLNDMDDDEILEFQMGVLELISKIKKKRS